MVADSPSEGKLLGGRYRLERMLGAGGMATVWLAKDERLDRRVAIKVLSDTLAADPSYVDRFQREARIAAGLSHPNLVNVFDSGSADERPYLVMEHVEGGTLAEGIADGSARELDAEKLAGELLDALAHIHAAGIVHRDVKPANVLIGPDGRARLTDFGIAQPEDATKITQVGQVIGTAEYMAPEVREGKKATERSDLYSAGVLLAEMLGRRRPRALGGLVKRLTATKPSGRPRSAAEALAALPGATAGRQTAPTEPGPTAPMPGRAPADDTGATRRLARPGIGAWLAHGNRRALLGLALAALLLLALIPLLGGGDEGAPPAAVTTEAPVQTERAPEPAAPVPDLGSSSCLSLETGIKALEAMVKGGKGKGKAKGRDIVNAAIEAQIEARKREFEQTCSGGGVGGDGEGGDD